METVYMVCAIVGGTLIACQFLLTLLGLGGDHDIGGHDGGGEMLGGDHEVGHGAESSWYFGMLTFRTLSAAFAFFGMAGMAGLNAGLEPMPTLGLALLAGFSALFIVGWLMRLLLKLNIDGTIRIDRAMGSKGTVYLSIPAARAGTGKVQVSILNRTIEYKAITAHGTLPAGAPIVVVGIINNDTVEVAPASEPERN